MTHMLQPHPTTPVAFPLVVEAKAYRVDNKLDLTFTLIGAIDRLRLPPQQTGSARVDGLWQHTCFEAFIRPHNANAYREINLASSGDWAAYCFEGYRKEMRDADIAPPLIAVAVEEDFALIEAIVTGPSSADTWFVGLSAVIEEIDGTRSYWALAHPPGKPDFHHRDCFALRLPPAG